MVYELPSFSRKRGSARETGLAEIPETGILEVTNPRTMTSKFLRIPARRNAFSLVELIVVITILGILSAIGLVSYSASLLGARDAARVADVDQLKMSLKSEKQKTGAYPKPGDAFVIVNSGSANVAAYQGFFNSNVAINDLAKYPADPLTKTSYSYSTTKNRQSFQIGTVVEDSEPWKSYLDGDYKTVCKNVLPSLVLATSGAVDSQVEIADGLTTS